MTARLDRENEADNGMRHALSYPVSQLEDTLDLEAALARQFTQQCLRSELRLVEDPTSAKEVGTPKWIIQQLSEAIAILIDSLVDHSGDAIQSLFVERLVGLSEVKQEADADSYWRI